MHIVHSQPFEDCRKWFYENLYGGKPPTNELNLAAESNTILVDRGRSFLTSYYQLIEQSSPACDNGLTSSTTISLSLITNIIHPLASTQIIISPGFQ